MPFVWSLNFSMFLAYILSSWLRAYNNYLSSAMTRSFFIAFSTSTTFEILCFCIVSTVFAVSPEENLLIHIVPYTLLILTLSILAIKNFCYYLWMVKLTSFERKAGYAYLVVHISVSLSKIVMHLNALLGDVLYCTLCYPTYHVMMDRLWLVTAGIIPIYVSLRFRKRAAPVVFETTY